MTGQDWSVRHVVATDEDALAAFRCAADQTAHAVEVQQWINNSLLQWVVGSVNGAERPVGLLLVESDREQIMAVSAFEEGAPLIIDDVSVATVRVHVLAVADEWQGKTDAGGTPIGSIILQATIERIDSVWPRRPITALIAVGNIRSAALFRRLGFAISLPHPTRPGYNLVIRPASD